MATTTILAQALPPLWTMALSIYLLAAIPLAFVGSVVAFALTIGQHRNRAPVRVLAALTAIVGLVDGISVACFARVTDLGSPGREDWLWLIMMAATVILGLVAWYRSRVPAVKALVLAIAVAGPATLGLMGCGSLQESQALWRSDGTPGGTKLVANLPERVASAWSAPVVVGESLFFLLNNGGNGGVELWKSDGTPTGTSLVKDLSPGRDVAGTGAGPRALGVGQTLYFAYEDPAHGVELWKSDGTPAGTGLVRDLAPGPKSSWPMSLQRAGTRLVFIVGLEPAGFAPATSIEPGIWSTDGASEGTVLLQAGTIHPYGSTVAGDEVYFVARNALWSTDGTPAGTRRIQALALTPNPLCTSLGGDVFVATSRGLFKLDRRNGDLRAGQPSLRLVASLPELCPSRVVTTASLVYVTAHQLEGSELWRSDGTANGTRLLRNFPPGGPGELITMGGRAFFGASTPASGHELWTTSGTAESTTLVADVLPGPESGMEEHATVLGERLLFTSTTGLWTSDGTAAGTVRIHTGFHNADFAVLAGTAYWLRTELSLR
jgi:ELWxxDGT repeat protein